MARRQFQRTAKRRMSWNGTIICLSDIVTATPQFVTVISEAILEGFPTPTIVRCRGSFMASLDLVVASNVRTTLTHGLIVATASAVAGSALPSPVTDVGSDWLWWYSSPLRNGETASVEGRIGDTDRVIVDSKAMRKVGLNEVLVYVAEVSDCELAGQVNVHGTLRILLKAP